MRIASMLVLAGCERVFPLIGPDAMPDANTDPNVVFVTGGQFDGNFGGLAGADEKCATAARTLSLSGTFVAWASVGGADTVNAISRLDGSRGWVRTDGAIVADLPTAFGISGPLVPISLTEDKMDVRTTPSTVWTGTDGSGILASGNCSEWAADVAANGKVGDPNEGPSRFSATSDKACTSLNRLYCFEIGKSAALTVASSTDPVWFVSEGLWDATGGIAAADAICTGEANAALPGTFKALLPTIGTTSASRFTPNVSYVRPDGVRIGTLSNPLPDTFPDLTAANRLVSGDGLVWTGGPPSAMGTVATTCDNWAATAASNGTVGDWRAADLRTYNQSSSVACATPHHIYCLQE